MATGAKRSKMHFSIDSGDVAHPVERMESLASNKSGIERRLRHVRDQIDRVRPADPRYRVLRTRDKIAESLRLERERKLPFVSTEGGVPAGIGTNKVARRFVAKQQRTIERLEKKLAAAQRRLDAEVRPSNKKLHALEQQERTILGELSETNSLYYRQKDLLRVLKEHDVLPVAVKGGITVNAPRSKKGYEALRAVTHSGWKYNRLKSEARLLRAAESIEKDILSTEAMWERQAGLFDKMVGVVRPGGHLSDEAIAAGRPALSRRPDFREDVTDTLIAKARRVGDRIFQNTYDRVMGNAIKEREGYFFHGLQNIKAINRKGLRSRVSTSAAPQRARQFLDIIENYEHGQDPVSDMKVITGMRMYAHARMMNKMEATKNVFADRRWAVPRHESRGLRAQDGWGDLTHPLTGEQYRVRTEVIEHFERAMSFMEPGKAENFIKHYWDPITSIWKGWATFARPAFYNLRNMLDDGFRMWMGGFSANPVEMGKSIKATFYAGLMGRLDIGEPAKRYARQARRESKTEFGKWFRKNKDGIADTFDAKLKEIADDVDTYGITNKRGETISPRQAHNAATQRGIVEKGYTTAELHPGDADLMESARKWDHEGMSWRKVTPYLKKANPLGSEGFWMQGTGATARFMENTRRMMLFIDRWRAGETFDEAAKQVKKWLFDYKELTGFERQVARRIVPFYTFMRKNIPAQMEAVMRHPGRYLAVGKAKRAVEAKAELEQGPIGVVRDYMDDLWAWRLPMTTKNGSPLFLNTGLSFVDFNVFGSFKNTGQEELFDRVHPGFDLWEVYKMERDPRTNLSLKGKWMEPDAILGAMVKGHNIAMPKWRQIPVMEMTQDESGHSYDVIPAYIVKSYEKMIPHFVAFGKVLGRDRVDPFMEESDPYRSLRERWAVTLMPNNPVKAEMERLRVLEKESFGGVKAIREGESLRPKK